MDLKLYIIGAVGFQCILSGYLQFRWVRLAYYHPRGIYKIHSPSMGEVFYFFTATLPFIGPVAPIIWWLTDYPLRKNYSKKSLAEIIFQPRDKK